MTSSGTNHNYRWGLVGNDWVVNEMTVWRNQLQLALACLQIWPKHLYNWGCLPEDDLWITLTLFSLSLESSKFPKSTRMFFKSADFGALHSQCTINSFLYYLGKESAKLGILYTCFYNGSIIFVQLGLKSLSLSPFDVFAVIVWGGPVTLSVAVVSTTFFRPQCHLNGRNGAPAEVS